MTRIEIFGRPGCSFCQKAVNYCQALKLDFVYRDISASQSDRDEMFSRNPNAKTVPQIFAGETLIGGFDDLFSRPIAQIQQMIGGK